MDRTYGTAAFFAAYDAVLGCWPPEVTSTDLQTRYGSTRVQICGPADGTPLVLLPGGGATSVAWFANIAELARTHRVHALDLMGDIGHSVPDGEPLRSATDLLAWLDDVLDRLGLAEAALCGHSYGAWIALNYALHAPRRVTRLALLEPTGCFAGLRPGYLLRALPMLLKHTPARSRAFHRWETGGTPESPQWQEFLDRGGEARRTKVFAMRRPDSARLRAATTPTLVLLAEHSKVHDVRKVAAEAARLLPHALVVTLPAATHHSAPTERPAELNRRLTEFLSPR